MIGICHFHGEINITRSVRIRKNGRPAYICPVCAGLLKIKRESNA